MFHYFVRCGDAMEWSNDVDDDDVGEAPSRDWFHTIIACNWDIKLRFYGEKYSFNWTINHYHPFGLRMNQKHTSHSQWNARQTNTITNKGTPNRKADVNAKNRSWKGRVRCIVFAVAFCVLNFAVVFFLVWHVQFKVLNYRLTIWVKLPFYSPFCDLFTLQLFDSSSSPNHPSKLRIAIYCPSTGTFHRSHHRIRKRWRNNNKIDDSKNENEIEIEFSLFVLYTCFSVRLQRKKWMQLMFFHVLHAVCVCSTKIERKKEQQKSITSIWIMWLCAVTSCFF